MPDSFPDTASSAAACGAASTRGPTFHWLFTRIAAEGTHAPQTLTPAAYAAITKPEPVAAIGFTSQCENKFIKTIKIKLLKCALRLARLAFTDAAAFAFCDRCAALWRGRLRENQRSLNHREFLSDVLL